MKKLIVANWKMNPESPDAAVKLARSSAPNAQIPKYRNIELVVAPPFPFLDAAGRVLEEDVKLGAQDVFWEERGAYTGEVSGRQLKAAGVEYVIIGHSERRMHLGETDEMVQKKVRAALAARLGAILCVGERERQGADIPSVVGDQLAAGLAGTKKDALKNLVIAYEPVWAISTTPGARGPDTPDSAFRARLYIEKVLKNLYGSQAGGNVRIIYGGSVNAGNAASFITEGQMDGLLVGSAALDAKEFGRIAAEVAHTAPAKPHR